MPTRALLRVHVFQRVAMARNTVMSMFKSSGRGRRPLILPFKEPRTVADWSAPLRSMLIYVRLQRISSRLTLQYHDALEQTRFQISSGLDADCALSVNLESGVW
jgi:hypothetical protein